MVPENNWLGCVFSQIFTNAKNKINIKINHSNRAAPRVEAHHHVNGPNTGRNSEGRWTIKKEIIQTSNVLV